MSTGSPVALDTPTSQGQHPHANNFEFKSDYNHGSEIKCPIAAHIRKMRPRADLYVSKTGEANVSAEENFTNNTNVILRRSVTFGPELKPGEEKVKPSERPKRGIHFMCYQAYLRNGFNLLITRWASNEVFAANSVQTRPRPGPSHRAAQPPRPPGAGVQRVRRRQVEGAEDGLSAVGRPARRRLFLHAVDEGAADGVCGGGALMGRSKTCYTAIPAI